MENIVDIIFLKVSVGYLASTLPGIKCQPLFHWFHFFFFFISFIGFRQKPTFLFSLFIFFLFFCSFLFPFLFYSSSSSPSTSSSFSISLLSPSVSSSSFFLSFILLFLFFWSLNKKQILTWSQAHPFSPLSYFLCSCQLQDPLCCQKGRTFPLPSQVCDCGL